MKLGAYLKATNQTPRKFAEKVPCHHSLIAYLLAGKRTPTIPMAERFAIATGFNVMPNDWMQTAVKPPKPIPGARRQKRRCTCGRHPAP